MIPGTVSVVECVDGLDLTGLEPASTNQARITGWHYDTSVYPPILVIPERPVIEDCADGSPQDVWGSLWESQKAREHYATCPKCQRWDLLVQPWR